MVFAGPAANFVLASVVFAILFGTMGDAIAQGPIAKISPGSAAEAAGFKVGDEIVAADGHRLRGYYSLQRLDDLQSYVAYRNGVSIDFAVLRAGKSIDIRATPAAISEPNQLFGGRQTTGRLGVAFAPQRPTIVHFNPIEALGLGVARTWDTVETTGFYLSGIFSGRVSADQLHSVVGMSEASGAITKTAIADGQGDARILALELAVNFANFCALISVTVGLVNLLPIPVLDGGHLLFYAYEAVARQPLPLAAQAAGYRVGLALLVGLMLFTTWHDLQRLQVFHFIGALFS